MRQLAFAAVALLLASTLGCRDKKRNEVGNVSDTAVSVVTPPAPDQPAGPRDFSFAERQEFAQSVRQQLSDIDGRIKQLASEAKSKGGAVSDKALASINASRKALDRDLKRIDTATEATWQEIKTGVNGKVEKLNESIEGAQPK